MKHTRQILIILLCIFFTGNIFAIEVTKSKATKVAKKYFSEVTLSRGMDYAGVAISESFDIKKDGDVVFYIFNFQGGGYIIVSAEDQFTPVLGYSPHGFYDADNKMPGGFEFLMEEFTEMIMLIRTQKIAATPEYTAKWERYSNDEPISFDRGVTGTPMVGPLVALWNQDSPYNYYCPPFAGGPGGRTYAGCVATAMSMIMYYWHWPWQGEGSHSYQPNSCGGVVIPVQSANFEETYYDYNGMFGTPEINADNHVYEPLALLQYHCGVAVDMNYCGIGEGSGAQSSRVPNAVSKYFKYDPSVQMISRLSYPNTVAWASVLKEQLDMDQPVYVSGGGHAYVCDGYDSDGLFHYNFGWSGHKNGYFVADQPSTYTSNLNAVINFIPDRSKGYPSDCNGNWTLPYTKGMLADCSGPIDFYDSDISASWLIDPEINGNKVENISFTCNSIDIATGDYLRIYDGTDESAPLLGEFSGGTNFTEVTTTGGKAFVTFKTAQNSPTGDGFLITYEAKMVKYCDPDNPVTFTAASGSFTDGSPEEYNYPNSSSCRWYIFPEGAVDPETEIVIDFKRMDTKDDGIKIYDFEKNKLLATVSGTYSDTELPQVVANARKVMIIFTANTYDNGKGFEMIYSTDPVKIKEVDNVKNLLIYPNPALNLLNVTFEAVVADNYQIAIYNIVGQKVCQESVNNYIGTYNKTFDISNFAQGIYLMQLKSSKGSIIQKISVQ